MPRSKHAVELCALVVDETYGELTSRIFTILLRRGRLPTSLLTKHTRLTPRQLRHGLAVLVQQNLVYHHFDEDSGITHYEANHEAAYGLVRSGKIMEAIESRFGDFAKDVVQNLFLLGHTMVSDLEGAYEAQQKQRVEDAQKKHLNGDIEVYKNGAQESYIRTTGQLHAVLLRLLQAGVIEQVFEHMFRSPTDTYNKIEKDLLELYYGGTTKGAKQKDELKMKIQAKLHSLRSDTLRWQSKGKKRPHDSDHLNDVNAASKRQRLSNSGSAINVDHYYEDSGPQLDSKMVIRVNYEKCVVFLRSHRLMKFANDRIGETTSLIYGEALRLLEKGLPRCRSDLQLGSGEDVRDVPKFNTMELTAILSHTINPGSGIGKLGAGKADSRASEMTISKSDRKNRERGEESDPFDEDIKRAVNRPKLAFENKPSKPELTEERESKVQQVRNHLQLLAADQCKFLRKCGSAGSGEWTVDFEVVMNHVRETEMDSMLLDNFGKFGHRLVRIMRKVGRLDEKQLPALALMKQKDVRTKLAEMQMAGIVDIQEVPRDNQHTPGRTLFLWFFDTERVSSIFVESVYKVMSRCFQRLDVERREASDIIGLTQRSDIRDLSPEEYMEKDQLTQLRSYQAKEEALLGQIYRLDELVGTFRDY